MAARRKIRVFQAVVEEAAQDIPDEAAEQERRHDLLWRVVLKEQDGRHRQPEAHTEDYIDDSGQERKYQQQGIEDHRFTPMAYLFRFISIFVGTLNSRL